MKTLNLSGFKLADSLSISVSQNALMAGPINVPAWGNVSTGGVISIVVPFRSLGQFAPDTVMFKVDLSLSDFDTAGPVGDEVYDARMHDLIYFWDFDDPRTWTAPQNILPHWTNANETKGPQVAHMFTAAGNYSPSVTVYEPSSGKMATATVSDPIVVGDPDEYYPDADTYYIRPAGDVDESWIPAGVPPENRLAIDSLRKLRYLNGTVTTDANWAQSQWVPPDWPSPIGKRWRFKRGGSYQVSLYLDHLDYGHITFDDYGDPAQPKPILTTPETPVPSSYDLLMFGAGSGHGQFVWPRAPEHRFRNLDCRGRFDPAVSQPDTDVGELSGAIGMLGRHWVAISNCDYSGFGKSIIAPRAHSADPTDYDGVTHMDNCTLKDFGGQYPFFGSPGGAPGSRQYRAMTGCRFTQKPDALDGARGLMRADQCPFVFLAGNDLFHADRLHGCFDLMKTCKNDGYVLVAYGNASEASIFISIAGNYSETPRKGPYAVNAIVDGFIHVAAAEFQHAFHLMATGVTIRNGMYLVPNKVNLNGVTGFCRLEDTKSLDGAAIPDFVKNAPIRFINCTFRNEQDSFGPYQIAMKPWFMPDYDYSEFNDVLVIDEVIHAPKKIPAIDAGPFIDTVLWQPRHKGVRLNSNPTVYDTTYASPDNCIVLTQPAFGSTALGTAVGDGAVTDAMGAAFKGDKGWVGSLI